MKKLILIFILINFTLLNNNHLGQSQSKVQIRIFKLIGLRELNLRSTYPITLNINSNNKKIKLDKWSSYNLKKKQMNLVEIRHKDKLLYSGNFTSITIPETHKALFIGNHIVEPRPYSGSFEIINKKEKYTYQWHCINTVDSIKYISSVVQSEIGALSQSKESIKSQAIVSRSYAHKSRHLKDGYDFCDTTHCQVYLGQQNLSPLVQKSVLNTQGMYLTYKNKIIRAYYHSTCGGTTTNPTLVWPKSKEHYIIGVYDSDEEGTPYCKDSPHYQWTSYIDRSKLMSMFLNQMGSPNSIEISRLTYDLSGRVKRLLIRSASDYIYVKGETFRITVGRNLGWNSIKSTYFEVDQRGGQSITIKGYGLGHGVGFCQYGAIKLGQLGKNYKQILNHYFPKCNITSIH